MALLAEDGQNWPVALHGGAVLGEVLVVGGVGDGLRWIFCGQNQDIMMVPLGAGTNPRGSLVNKESGLGIGTSARGTPEGRADPNLSRLAGI